ncbi:enoyl-CoA hydratase/isomerase family protein [Streptomyces sp. NPDC058382]|uniref:enoyl-CoA hydratase/isomerase family protein n=1 Tax=unclassified Streptomyces TaxID=2593676 RepID=UPI0036258826
MTVLEVEKQGPIAIVTLNRPARRNSFTPEMLVRLADAWDDIEADPAIRVAVLTGAGDAAFCSGGDLAELVPLATGARPPENDWDHRFLADSRSILNRALLRRTDFYKPLIAAITGDAFAGGTEITLSADIRIASETARFALPEVRRGIIPSGGSLARLARQIGWTATMELILVAEPITAAHAREVSLVNRVVPRDQVLATSLEYAQQIALGAPFALAKAKEAIVQGSGRSLDEAFLIEAGCQDLVMASDDAREGPLAFVEKRAPRWSGR